MRILHGMINCALCGLKILTSQAHESYFDLIAIHGSCYVLLKSEPGFSISFDKKFRTWPKSANFAKFRPKFIFRLFLNTFKYI